GRPQRVARLVGDEHARPHAADPDGGHLARTGGGELGGDVLELGPPHVRVHLHVPGAGAADRVLPHGHRPPPAAGVDPGAFAAGRADVHAEEGPHRAVSVLAVSSVRRMTVRIGPSAPAIRSSRRPAAVAPSSRAGNGITLTPVRASEAYGRSPNTASPNAG